MPKFRVNLNRTSMDNCDVIVEADSAEEAKDSAIDDFIGQHDWQNQETIEISASSCEEI